MGKPSLIELQSLPDPAQSDHYELIFPTIPGAPAGASQAFRIQCQSAALPGLNIEPGSQESAGNQLQHAGRATINHDFSITFIESRTLIIHKAIRRWMKYTRNHNTQLGHYKSEYGQNATLIAYDQKGVAVDTFQLFGVWPSAIPEYPFDGTASNIVTIAATFQIDYWEAEGDPA